MKLLFIAATALLLASCGGKKKDDPGKTTGSGEATTLGLNVKPGDVFNQNVVMNIDVNTNAAGQDVKVKMNFDAGMKFDVQAGDTSGLTNLKMTYTKASADMDMGAAAPAGSGAKINDMIAKIMGAMIGEPILVGVDKSGKISGPYNMEDFSDRLMKKLDSLSIPRAAGQQFAESMGKKNMENSLQLMFSYLPDHPVKPGESWTKETTQENNGIRMKLKNTYTLDKVDGGIAYITVKSVAANDGEMETGNGAKIKEMTLTQTGDMQVRVDKGYVKKSNMEMKMDAKVEAMGMQMPMKMTAKYAISE